jgi:predicted acetyltransferase
LLTGLNALVAGSIPWFPDDMSDSSSDLVLRPLRVDDEAQARTAHEELAADDFEFLLAQRAHGGAEETWAEYVERLEEARHGRGLDPGFVPASFLVAEVDGTIVGRTSIRHELNEFLSTWGGHIGYGVRPAHRRRGHATEILRQSLAILADLGVDEALVTCDVDNAGSEAVIRACGGFPDPELPLVAAGAQVTAKKRFLVPTGWD